MTRRRPSRKGSRSSFAADDRGQLLLVAAVVIAAALIGVMIIVNSAGVVPVQDRSGVVSTGEHVDATVAAAADAVRVESRVEHDTEAGAVQATDAGVSGVLGDRERFVFERHGMVVDASVTSITTGERVVQDDGTAFTASGGETDWRVAEFDGVREVRMTVTGTESFGVVTDEQLDAGSSVTPAESDAFRVVTVQGGSEWRGFIGESENGDDVVVATMRDGDVESSCRVPAPDGDGDVTVDWTAGVIEHDGSETACDVAFADAGDGSGDAVTVDFVNGDSVTGSYELTGHGQDGADGVAPENVDSVSTSGASPRYHAAPFSVTVTVTADDRDSEFQRVIRIVPGDAGIAG